MGGANRREMHAELTRTAVVDAARALFVAKGFEATSVDEIARASQSSKGAVYHHFQDKQAIFAEVFRASQAAIMQAVLPPAIDHTQPWEQALHAISAVLRWYAEDDVMRMLVRESAGALGWDRKQALDEEIALPILRAVLNQLIEAGEVAPMPVGVTAELILALLNRTAPIIAAADDPVHAVTEIEPVVLKLLDGLHRERVAPSD